jgi:hypothetical protein
MSTFIKAGLWTKKKEGFKGELNLDNLINSLNFTGYDYEIHVSQIDGSDTTGDGDLLNPVATITKALTLVTVNRRTIIVHPGAYNESP